MIIAGDGVSFPRWDEPLGTRPKPGQQRSDTMVQLFGSAKFYTGFAGLFHDD